MRKLIFILIALVSFSHAQTIQYIGAPTTTVISKGNFRTDSIFYLPKRTKLPTDTAAFRYQISDSSLYVWSGYQWLRAGGSGSINGTLTTNYIPKATGTATIGNSLLYTSGNNLMFNSTTPYTTNSGWSTSEVNASSVALNVWKINDTARGYIAHNGTLMEINNLRNGDLTFVTNSSTRGRFTSTGDFRVNTLGGTGSRVVVASSNGTLSAGSSATDLIDTTYISSRAWRQKGDDSLGAIIATKGSGTVTSVATGYGLSGGTITTTGTLIADTLNLSTKLWRQKGIDSVNLIASNKINGAGGGTTNYHAKFFGSSTVINSIVFDNGTNVGISTTDLTHKLRVNGNGRFDATANKFIYLDTATHSTLTSLTGALTFSRTDGVDNMAALFGWNNGGLAMAGRTGLSFATGGGVKYPETIERARITDGGELLINTTTDAGAYTLQNNGALYNTGSAILAATSGGVTIGSTATPLSELDIYGTTSLAFTGFRAQQLIYSTEAFNANPNASIGFVNKFTSGGGYGTLGSISVGKENATDGNASGYMSFYTYGPSGLTEKMRITSNGNVGIGTASPTQRLDVNGYIVSGVTDRVLLGQDGTYTGYSTVGFGGVGNGSNRVFGSVNASDGLYLASATGRGIRFRVNGADVDNVIISSAGETLFGTTTDAGAYRVQVNGATYISKTDGGEALVILGNSNTASLQQNGSDLYFNTNTNTTGGGFYFRNTSSYNVLMNLTSSGELLVGTTTDAGNYRVQVSGDILANFIYTRNNTDGLILGTNAAVNPYIQGLSSNGVVLGTSNTARLTVTSTGNIGLSTLTPNASALLDMVSTTQGFLPPRMTTTQRDLISSPAAGLVIYNTTTSKLQVYTTSWTDLH